MRTKLYIIAFLTVFSAISCVEDPIVDTVSIKRAVIQNEKYSANCVTALRDVQITISVLQAKAASLMAIKPGLNQNSSFMELNTRIGEAAVTANRLSSELSDISKSIELTTNWLEELHRYSAFEDAKSDISEYEMRVESVSSQLEKLEKQISALRNEVIIIDNTLMDFENMSQPVVSQPGAVDLGLSVKWASCNLGATKPEDYGGYYQWAGTSDVSALSNYLSWDNCPYHSGSSYSSGWTKYIPSAQSAYWSGTGSPDDKTTLDPVDDAAHVVLGGKWRMPTKAECEELSSTSNCTWTWTSLNGVNGYKVQSKKSGYTDKWIFLPAAGYRLYGNLYNAVSTGYYWSSSLLADYPHDAYYLYFFSGRVYTGVSSRYYGLSVRPVSE